MRARSPGGYWFAIRGPGVNAAVMTSQEPNQDATSELEDEVLTTPATPGAAALPSTDPADVAGNESKGPE
jgi:hypothetical protein